MRGIAGVRTSDVVLAIAVLAGMVLVAVLGRAPAGGSDTFSATDYRSGGYAAWFTLLQREGVATERFERRPADLDARIAVLIAAVPAGPADTGTRGRADRAALERWVYGGGRLVELGGGGGAFPPLRPARAAGGTLHGALAAGVARLAGLSADRFVARRRRMSVLLGDRGGAIALRLAYGRGDVAYVSDPHPFDNALIAHADNARLAYVLVQPRPGETVAFDETLHGALIERTWWQAIDVPERVALAGIALAILLALGGSALRLGPAVTLREAREPASDEFIAAVAALYERNKARRAAIGLLAAGAQSATGAAADELRRLAERESPADRDLIASAILARTIREGT